MDEASVIPEEMRCKRSDGKQWRCNALSMPDKTVCEKHYIQAKKRAANSALRANLRKAKRRGDLTSSSPSSGKRAAPASASSRFEEERVGNGGYVPEYYGRNTDSFDDAEVTTCHQCRRNDRMRVLWCMSCGKRGYCDSCVARWYGDISLDDIQKVCPTCRGICSCITCRRGDTMIKARIQEVSVMNRLQCLHSLLSFALPVLKRIHSDQCSEVKVEKRINGKAGVRTDIPRAIINPDEQMCCDICSMPILDYHRHCTNCSTDICLQCVQDLRAGGKDVHNKRFDPNRNVNDQHILHHRDNCALDFLHLYPKWKVYSDGSIPCSNNCCRSSLILRRILKINWVSKLLKNTEEMVSGCRVSDVECSENCILCSETTSQRNELNGGNFLYSPASDDIRDETIAHFRKHWIKGEPIIVRKVIDSSLASTCDPMSICKGILEIACDRIGEDNPEVTAVNCLTNTKVNVKLEDFIRGYSEGRICEDNTPEILKLKDWPQHDALEDFLLCQRPEILTCLPLLEYIHPRWGLVNLAAKLPHDTLHTDAGPKLCIAYGSDLEQYKGESLMNLRVNMTDTVHLLIHTSEMKFQYDKHHKHEKIAEFGCEKRSDAYAFDIDMHEAEEENYPSPLQNESSGMPECFPTMAVEKNDDKNQICNGNGTTTAEQGTFTSHVDEVLVEDLEKDCAGIVWDVFSRQDVPKLNEYLKTHSEELGIFNKSLVTDQVQNPVFGQAYFLNKDHKMKLKEEYGIEPWTLKQDVGEAVFVPAGCAFQVKNIKSTMQLVLDFLSPESLADSIVVAQQIRCLPSDHVEKLQMLEVLKMPLYAASWAIKEIEKITLDPKVGSELGFEDRNLTARVLDNLQRVIKRNQVKCI